MGCALIAVCGLVGTVTRGVKTVIKPCLSVITDLKINVMKTVSVVDAVIMCLCRVIGSAVCVLTKDVLATLHENLKSLPLMVVQSVTGVVKQKSPSSRWITSTEAGTHKHLNSEKATRLAAGLNYTSGSETTTSLQGFGYFVLTVISGLHVVFHSQTIRSTIPA